MVVVREYTVIDRLRLSTLSFSLCISDNRNNILGSLFELTEIYDGTFPKFDCLQNMFSFHI